MRNLIFKIKRLLFWKLLFLLKRKPYWVQILIFYVTSIVVTILSAPFIYLTEQVTEKGETGPDTNLFVLILIIAPILETYFSQHLVFKIMQHWSVTKKKYGIYIILSSLIFGVLHTYSASYVVYAFTVGLILSYTYYFYCKNPGIAFWSTALIHFLRNSIAYIYLFFET